MVVKSSLSRRRPADYADNSGGHMRDRHSSSHLTGRRSDLPFWLVRSHDAAGFPLAREPRRCSRGSPGPHAALVYHGGYWPGPGESHERHC